MPGFFRTSPTLRMMERRLPIFQWSPDQTDETLRLSVDLSFGGGRIDSHHIRMSVHNAICQLATEGAITPDHEDHAILKSWSLTAASAEEA